jgi:molecular chaperone DnaK
VATKLIERNTTIPTARTQVFSTASDNQTSVEINIVQGERAMARDNKNLGRFVLDGIPPSPRGMPQVEVSFDVDANGILSVTAKDKATGKAQSIKIQASSGISKDDIEKMKKDAEAHEAEDKKKREETEIQNTADQLVYTAEKSLRDFSAKIPEDVKKGIEAKIEAVKTAKGGTDIEAVKKATEELSAEMQKIGQYMQSNQQQATDNKQQEEKKDDGKENGGEGNVRDAEFKEKK